MAKQVFILNGHKITQTSAHRFWVNRFNDPIKGKVMFTTLVGAEYYIDTHSINQ